MLSVITRVRVRAARSQPTLACSLPEKVCSTIVPLQRIEGHMQSIQIIDIGLHTQRVMYACLHESESRKHVYSPYFAVHQGIKQTTNSINPNDAL